MYFSASQILSSINKLGSINPFFGITFLVCKKEMLPVGVKIDFPLDQKTKEFLEENHRIHPASPSFFQPFGPVGKKKRWVRPDYASGGLQSINTRTFGPAFLHDSGTRRWGWHPDYIETLRKKLTKDKKIPAFDLAVWLFRSKRWPEETKPQDVLDFFFDQFHISEDERARLFDDAPYLVPEGRLFQDHPVQWPELSPYIKAPPDTGPDPGGTLSFLELRNLGPAKCISFFPARRLNIITGDNGLGKSFLLECAWWALTGTWPEMPAYPNKNFKENESSITFELAGRTAHPLKKKIAYDFKSRSWPKTKRPTIPGLIVYARVDGSFAVWDPARFVASGEDDARKATLVLGRSDVWNGLPGNIEGLIRDWTRWQNSPDRYLFDVFCKVLKRLSPPDLGDLVPGDPVRIPNDPRDIPTIVHPYGTTPILFTSAGVRRIITMAYLMVWAWNEHHVNSELYHMKPEARMVVMIDEIEAHLHPKWQRIILPALLDVQGALSRDLEIQFFITTHSPLILASAEPVFDDLQDELFHLDFADGNEVRLEVKQFIKLGQVNSWLTSPIFEMRHARSKEAEDAIEAAKNLQKRNDVNSDEVREVNERLVRHLAVDDQFWPRWIYFAERYGVVK